MGYKPLFKAQQIQRLQTVPTVAFIHKMSPRCSSTVEPMDPVKNATWLMVCFQEKVSNALFPLKGGGRGVVSVQQRFQ